MRIGELAARAGVTTRALRYYESRGLLAAQRDANGNRAYSEDDLRLLRQIRALQEVGFELEETRPFTECLLAGYPTGDDCPEALDVYRRKLAKLDECIAQLQTIRDEVRTRLASAEAREALRTNALAAPVPRCALTPMGTRGNS
jgi:DNA-binding transcriptional MerR regulator